MEKYLKYHESQINTTIKYFVDGEFVDNVTADKANKIYFKEDLLPSRKRQCL